MINVFKVLNPFNILWLAILLFALRAGYWFNIPPKMEFAFTGPSYTNLPGIVAEAAMAEGVNIEYRKDADEFFARSDNYPFALEGVPDSTIAVAFEYPEYHKVGDTADKIDFDNMAKVDRAIAAGIARIADESGVPQWSAEKGAVRFRNMFRNAAVR